MGSVVAEITLILTSADAILDDDDAIMTAVAAVATVVADDIIDLLGVDAITADVAATPVRAPPPLLQWPVQDIPPPLLIINGPINSSKKDDGKLAITAAMRKGTNRLIAQLLVPTLSLSLVRYWT